MLSLNGVLTYRGLELNKNDILEKYQIAGYKKLVKKFIIRYKSPIGTFYIEKKNFQYLKDENILLLPRFASEDLLKCKIVSNIENRIQDGIPVDFLYIGEPTNNQQIVIDYIFKNIYTKENKIKGICGITLNAQAGCHIKDTKIIMFDGTTKMVQNIEIGDIIMGDDSTPRNVLKLCRGKEMMYKITNVKNESYIVNENHILCLKYSNKKNIRDDLKSKSFRVSWFNTDYLTSDSKSFTYKNKNKENIYINVIKFFNNIEDNLNIEISVKNYLNLSPNLKKYLKGYKHPIFFPNIDLPLDPYMIGYWLGDGNSNTSVITTQESSIINYFQHNLIKYKCYLQYNGKSHEYSYRINGDGTGKVGCNHFLNTLQNLNLLNNKHIPHIYKCNSRENQLKLLAGILDADGSLKKTGGFEFCQSLEHEQIVDDVIYLCRSLGFACYKNIKKTSWTYKGIKKFGEAWRISISGEGIEEIPTLSPRKKANPRQQIKDALVSGIKVEKLEIEHYYGFELDGNHKYVMNNFIVTHNSGKTFCAMNIINRLQYKTLIIVPNTYLLNQWIQLLTKFFPNNKIGQYYGKKKEDGDIIVAIINSLVNDEFIFDEVELPYQKCMNEKCKNKAKYNFEDIELPGYCNKHKLKSMMIIKSKKIIKSYYDFFKEFGFIILDESHIYCTDSFKVIYNRFQSAYMLGLSATPDERNTKCDIISHLNIGKVLKADEIEGYKKDDVKFNATVKLIKYNAPDEYINTHINETTKMICVPKIIEDIVNDEFRNKLIIYQLIELFHLKLNIFVFSERRSHLEHLYELFNNIIGEDTKDNISIPELNINNNIVLYGNSSDDDIVTAKTNSNIIFTTYAYSSTGVSINRMTALLLTTPRRSKAIQIIGRIFRLDENLNHLHRHIIDIIDNKSVLKNQVYERMKAYKDRECIIEKKEINYTEIIL